MGIDYQDYVRAKITDVDPLKQTLSNTCKKVEYINLRGHLGLQTTVAFWNHNGNHMHTDSSARKCAFKATGGLPDEDNWGHYGLVSPKSRCTATAESTTQYWTRDYIRGNVKTRKHSLKSVEKFTKLKSTSPAIIACTYNCSCGLFAIDSSIDTVLSVVYK